jgi:WD40 repeat protein
VARLWPWRDGPPIELRGHEDEVTDGWFLSGGSKVLTIGADATARLWSSTDGALLRTFRSELGPLCLAAVDEQAGLLAVTGKEARLQLFALATGAPLRTCSTHSGFRGREGTTPTCIAFDPQNHHLYLSALDTSTVLCFDRNRDWATMELDGVGSGSTGWALPDPLGKVVICTEYVLGNTRWFDARTQLGLPWDTAWQPGTKISRVAFSPDGSVALLASWDGTVHLLDLRTLQPWSVLRSDQGAMDAAFSPDGNAVAVGHRDGTIRVWPVDPLPAARAHRVRRQPQ